VSASGTGHSSETYECDALVVGLRRGRAVGGGDRGTPRAQGAGRREGAALRRTTARSGGWAVGFPIRRWRGPGASSKIRSRRGTYLRHEAGNAFDAARVDAFLDRRARGGRFLHHQNGGTVRHAADFSGLSRRSPRRRAGRPLDGDAAIRRTRARGPHIKDLGNPLPELTVFGMMLGSGKEIIHFMRVTKSLASALYVAKRLSKHLVDVMRHGRGMTLTNGNALCRPAGQIGVRPEHSAVAVVAGARIDRRGRRGARRDRRTRGTSGSRARQARRHPCLRRLSARRRAAPENVSACAERPGAFFAGTCGQYRRRAAAGGVRRRPGRGQPAECGPPGCRSRSRRATTAARA